MSKLRFVFLYFLLSIFFYSCGFSRYSLYEGVRANLDSVPIEEVEQKDDDNDATGVKKKEIDIIFLIDTSYRMVYHLQEVSNTFKGFLKKLSSVSWKLAFTNTDYDSNAYAYYGRNLFFGRAMKLELKGIILPYSYLYHYSPQNEDIFMDTLRRYKEKDLMNIFGDVYVNPCDLPPYCQGSISNPIQSLIQSFTVNRDMFRNNADFVGIIFTNGDNLHNENGLINKVIKEFQRIHGLKKKIRVYSISIIPEDQPCFTHDQSLQYEFAEPAYGKQIHELVKATEGKTISICAPSYAPLAEAIALSL